MTRLAHCIGCGVTFDKMHMMINHRRLNRCGGRFLPVQERILINNSKASQSVYNNTGDTTAYHISRSFYIDFITLRKRRLNVNKS